VDRTLQPLAERLVDEPRRGHAREAGEVVAHHDGAEVPAARAVAGVETALVFDLDVHGAASDREGLAIGLAWWIPALLLALGYFAYLFRSFRGKVAVGEGAGYGH